MSQAETGADAYRIAIVPVAGRVRARIDGHILADTTHAMMMHETYEAWKFYITLADVDADALGPDRRLRGGAGAERVGRGDEDAKPPVLQRPGDLGHRGRLSRAVDPHHQDHGRRVFGERNRVVDVSQTRLEPGLEEVDRVRSLGDAPVAVGLAKLAVVSSGGRSLGKVMQIGESPAIGMPFQPSLVATFLRLRNAPRLAARPCSAGHVRSAARQRCDGRRSSAEEPVNSAS